MSWQGAPAQYSAFDPYVDLYQAEEKSNHEPMRSSPEFVEDYSTRHRDNGARPSTSIKSRIYLWIVPLCTLIPIVALIVWLAASPNNTNVFSSFTGATIGGHLTQTQAKGIDFVCSAILAPALISGLNLLWFTCARVCAVNEAAPAVPLETLATVSTMSHGTYNVFEFWSLFKGRTWRLVGLAGIALFSAIGGSALGNMIAYEAFNEIGPSTTEYPLRLLRDSIIETPSLAIEYGFNPAEYISAAENVTNVLYSLEFGTTILDEEGGYIGLNATDASMNSLDDSITSLYNVPGFRLSAECVPTTGAMVVSPGAQYVEMMVTANYSSSLPGFTLPYNTKLCSGTYFYIGGEEDAFTDTVSSYAFPAWGSRCGDVFNLVYLQNTNTSGTMPSPWGDVQPTHQNLSLTQVQTSATFYSSVWTLQCAMYNQQGLLNYTRSSDLQWTIANSSFDNEKTVVSSYLSDWQQSSIGNWQAPQLGTALLGRMEAPCDATSCDLDTSIEDGVKNYVYASGEITRIIYNIAAKNATRTAGHPEFFHNVTGSVNQQFYRITYVPVLLLLGLLGIIVAGLLTNTLMFAARGTVSWAWFRQVDILRLVVDAVGGGLRHEDEEEFARLQSASNRDVSRWASRYCVGYVKVLEEENHERGDLGYDRMVTVRLVPKTGRQEVHDQKWASGVGMDELQEQPRKRFGWRRTNKAD
ncbi:hypothetical protein B0H19DRAFT_1077001 [Mycena capillaripes]|nr:hypothetical protein B0H19DRAFT_1077001 [Mycena capillaripes]